MLRSSLCAVFLGLVLSGCSQLEQRESPSPEFLTFDDIQSDEFSNAIEFVKARIASMGAIPTDDEQYNRWLMYEMLEYSVSINDPSHYDIQERIYKNALEDREFDQKEQLSFIGAFAPEIPAHYTLYRIAENVGKDFGYEYNRFIADAIAYMVYNEYKNPRSIDHAPVNITPPATHEMGALD